MSVNKKYYWLKLKNDFFNNRQIKKLRRIAGGDTYTIIYLKLQLLSIDNGGIIEYKGTEKDIFEQLELEIDEDIDNIKITMNFLMANDLLECVDNDVFLNEVPNLIGSECKSAERVRKYRKNKELENQKALQSNNKTLQCNAPPLQCNTDVTKCNTEIEKEKEKELDLELERETEIDTKSQSEINQLINQDCSLGKEMPTQLENNIKSEIKNNSEQAKIIEEWNSIDDNVPNVTLIRSGSTRQRLLQARINEYGFDNVLKAIDNVKNSQYLKGYVKSFRITFDWFIKPNNFPKVLDGNYNDFTVTNNNDEEFDYIKANQYTEEEIKNFKTAKDLYSDIDDYIVNIEDLQL